jgi:ABC-type transport system involved in cytochrome bd biosynthesis fused ATPase/permease subunit
VFEQFISLAENKTAIVISHRFFITPLVDRIFVLEHGRLIEEGSHGQLMKRDGVYASMYNTQVGMYSAQKVDSVVTFIVRSSGLTLSLPPSVGGT